MVSALENIIRRPRTVLTMMIVMIAAGITAYISVPKEANPDIDIPVFYISIPQQGISPEDAERLLVRPMETKLRGLDGLKEISATASEGHAGIVLEFNIDFDKEAALADVRDKVDQAKAELPADAEEPQIFETNFSLVPTIIVVLSGNVPERTLYQNARRLKDQIEAIPSVLEANLSGQREELLEVVIDTMKLESYNITQQELINTVSLNNRLVPAGFLDNGQGRFNVKVPGLFETAKDVYGIPIKVSGDAVVTLGDVAEIRRTFKDPTSFTRFNGQPAIAIEVVKRIGTNIVDNNEKVRQTVAEFTKDWPETIKVDLTLDESRFIFEVLGSLQSSIMTAIALVMIVVVGALGLRSGLMVGFAIPASFMVGFLIVGLLGMTVNMMVMFGLVLTVGMLVDGAIVMTEYADRKMAEGLQRAEAYQLAANRMFWPIVSSTATTLAAFLPMLMWPGVPGEFMSYLPVMVIIVLSASLLTAMVFLPVIGSVFGAVLLATVISVGLLIYGVSAFAAGHELVGFILIPGAIALFVVMYLSRNRIDAKLFRVDPNSAEVKTAQALSGAGDSDLKQVSGFTGTYVSALRFFIRHPILTAFSTIIILAGVVTAFTKSGAGVEFFVDEEPERAVVLVSARGNLSATEMRDLVAEVEAEILKVEGIKNLFMNAGANDGNRPMIGGSEDKPVDQIGQFTLELESYCCRRKAKEIFAEVRELTAPLAGLRVEVRKIEGGPPTGKAVRLEISGSTYQQVKEATGIVRAQLNRMEGLRDVEDSRPLPGIEWELQVDREQAGRFGTDIASVGAMIQLVTNGVLVGKYRPDDSEDEIDIRARLPRDERSIDRLDELRIQTQQGLVPIRNFVSREPQPKVSSIHRQNGRFAMMAKANVVDGVLGTEKVAELDSWLKQQTWSDGLQFRFRGADAEEKESGIFLMKALIASLFLMFIILVTQFNSFYQTVLTLLTVVMSSVGVMLGMTITGQNFSIIMTGTGIVALAGIVVNNAIILIDTYNRMHGELGLHPVDSALRAGAQRLRPILLTTFTTILGLVPMALQITMNFFSREITVGGITSIWWVQLSTAIIFGLGFSTLLTLVLIPTLLAAPTVIMEALGFGRKNDTETTDTGAETTPELAHAAPAHIRQAAE